MGLVERSGAMGELEQPAPRPGRSRDLFGVQLEVSQPFVFLDVYTAAPVSSFIPLIIYFARSVLVGTDTYTIFRTLSLQFRERAPRLINV